MKFFALGQVVVGAHFFTQFANTLVTRFKAFKFYSRLGKPWIANLVSLKTMVVYITSFSIAGVVINLSLNLLACTVV